MSKYFIEANEVTRVDVGDDQWVDVKTEFTQADMDYISNKQIKIKTVDTKPDFNFDLGALALLERGVVKWSFTEPVTVENISNLRNPYRTTVLNKINELNSKSKPILKN